VARRVQGGNVQPGLVVGDQQHRALGHGAALDLQGHAGLAEVCEVQLSYAIGVAKPTSVLIDTQGTGLVPDSWLAEQVEKHFELTPRGIIASLGLRKPIYKATATHGHFGRKPGEGGPGTFTWEATDKAATLRKAAETAGLLGKSHAAVEPKPVAKSKAPRAKRHLAMA
jgi:hypothetical protein